MITERQRLWQITAKAIMSKYQENIPVRDLPEPWHALQAGLWGVKDVDDKRENPFIKKGRKDAVRINTKPPQYY